MCVGWVIKNPYSFPLLVYFSLLNEICSSPACSRKKIDIRNGSLVEHEKESVALMVLYQTSEFDVWMLVWNVEQ